MCGVLERLLEHQLARAAEEFDEGGQLSTVRFGAIKSTRDQSRSGPIPGRAPDGNRFVVTNEQCMRLFITFGSKATGKGESLRMSLVYGRSVCQEYLVTALFDLEFRVPTGVHQSSPIERTQLALEVLHQWLSAQRLAGDSFAEFCSLVATSV